MKLREIKTFLLGTLRGRLILGVALVHAVMMTLFIIDLTRRQRKILLDRQEEEALALSRTLSVSAAEWLAALDISGLQELVDAQRRYPELIFATLTDANGIVLANTERSRNGQYLLDLPKNIRQTVITKEPGLVDVVVPAFLGGRHVGWARVGIGQKATGKKLAAIILNGMLYTIAAILIGSVIAWVMGRQITRRLYVVQDTMNRISKGNHAARTHIAGTDEAAILAREFNSMLDNLSVRNTELSVSESRFKKLFNLAPIPLGLVNATGAIMSINERFEQTFGYTSRDIPTINEWWQLAYPDQDIRKNAISSWEAAVRQASEENTDVKSMEYRVTCKGGAFRTVVISGTMINDDLLATFFDITERKQAEEALLALNAELEQHVRDRTAQLTLVNKQLLVENAARGQAEIALRTRNEELKGFAYTVSHDLKAPLRGIAGYASELDRQYRLNLGDRAQFCIGQILVATRNLDRLIEDLLQYSRLDAETPSSSPVNLNNLVKGILHDRNLVIGDNGVEVKIAIPDISINTWERGLSQVLANLIDNALKYSRNAHPPRLCVSAEKLPGITRVAVQDNGIGFEMKYYSRIFGLFNRLVRADEFEGTGAGLAIVKKLIEKVGGEIHAESVPGMGSTFYIEIPDLFIKETSQ